MTPTIHTITVTINDTTASVGVAERYIGRAAVIELAVERLFLELIHKGIVLNRETVKTLSVEYEKHPPAPAANSL